MSEEKKEQPTQHKLKKAREDGQVPISRDFASIVKVLAVGEIAFMTESLWRESLESLLLLGVKSVNQPFDVSFAEIMSTARLFFGIVILGCLVMCTVLAFLANWGQFGPLVATKLLKFDLTKLNPVNGIKQLFSQKKLIELLMTLVKVTLVALVMYYLIRGEIGDILALSGGTPKDVYQGFIILLRRAFHIVVGIFFVLAVIDLVVQRALHIKSLRMDLEEIKNESKENEGDPLIKGKRRQLGQELIMSDPVTTTANASAVVVNPTHFAVGLFYDPAKPDTVPIVICKGKDWMAQAMIERAKSLGIPVIRHVWLARTLYATCPPPSVVPRSSYESVAEVFAVVMELNQMDAADRNIELESDGRPPDSQLAE